jgi:hypothetical protein
MCSTNLVYKKSSYWTVLGQQRKEAATTVKIINNKEKQE